MHSHVSNDTAAKERLGMNLRLPTHQFDHLPQAYLIGGAVRDLILGVEPVDYDIAVPSPPDKFARIIAQRLNGKIVKLGKDRFSLYRVVSDTLSVDITAVKHDDIDLDLRARDFTVNAIAYDLTTNNVIDITGGLKDLHNKRIKMVSSDAFTEDPVRLIRAYRLAVALNFEIDSLTLQAIARQAATIKGSPGERIWAELKLIMTCPNSFSAIQAMADTALLFAVIPELEELQDCPQNRYHASDAFNHTLKAYLAMEQYLLRAESSLPGTIRRFLKRITSENRILSKMSVLLHDIGKPASRTQDELGNTHYYGHAAHGAKLSREICRRLHMSNRQQQWIEKVIRYHQRPLSLYLAQRHHPLRPKTVGRFYRQCGESTPYVLVHAIVDAIGKEGPTVSRNQELHNFLIHLLSSCLERSSQSIPDPIINGNDIMELHNIPPSPILGKILSTIQELQMAGVLKDREQALKWVSEYLKTRKQ